jgi:hypothetical protein
MKVSEDFPNLKAFPTPMHGGGDDAAEWPRVRRQ